MILGALLFVAGLFASRGTLNLIALNLMSTGDVLLRLGRPAERCHFGDARNPALLTPDDWKLLRFAPCPVLMTKTARPWTGGKILAAVDVGILNLTNYKPPAPDDYYLGQRRLTAEIRDLYGQLIDGMQGTRGQIRSGGDAGGAELQGSPPTQKPLALFSGIVSVGPDGSAEVSFDIPEFAGTARVIRHHRSFGHLASQHGACCIADRSTIRALPRKTAGRLNTEAGARQKGRP